jgi:hypothetical protein
MCRTISVNYLVQIGTFCHLKIISKFCIVTPWYYCMVWFYTLQGLQGYQICNFWPSRLISMDFTSCSKFERKFESVWLWSGHVAVSDRGVPVQPDRVSEPFDLSLIQGPRLIHTDSDLVLILAAGSWFNERAERREGLTGGLGFWRCSRFWGTVSSPGDSEHRGWLSGEVSEVEVDDSGQDCSPENH